MITLIAMVTFIILWAGVAVLRLMAFFAAFPADWFIFGSAESADVSKTLTDFAYYDSWLVYEFFYNVVCAADFKLICNCCFQIFFLLECDFDHAHEFFIFLE